MRTPTRTVAVLAASAMLVALAFAQGRVSPDALPGWLQRAIAGYQAHPKQADVASIWRITHHGAPAYYMVAPCCDRFNDLLDARGMKICSPSGGLAGGGDGRCPAPVDPGTPVDLVWRNPAIAGTPEPSGLGIDWPYHPQAADAH